MVKISERMKKISESPTLATSAKVNVMKAQGKDILNLTVGEPDFDTHVSILNAAVEAIQSNKANHYTPTAGILPLRQAIVDYHQKYDGVTFAVNQVIVTEGAKNALFALFQVILNPGDEVIVPAPYWVSYTEQIKLAGGVNVLVETAPEKGFKLTVEDLEKHRTEKTVALLLNSPSNPTGMIYTPEELKAIGEWAVEHDVLIIADEIYYRLTYNGNNAISIASLSEEIKNQTIIINGISKTYAMTGWRIGYAIGNAEIISKMIELSSHSTSNPAGPSQYGALAALTGPQDFVEEMRAAFEARLNFFYPLVASIPGFKVTKPQGAFYLFPNVKEAAEMCGFKEVKDFTLALIEEANVALVSGDGFGYPDYARISYTVREELLAEAVDRIKKFIETHKK